MSLHFDELPELNPNTVLGEAAMLVSGPKRDDYGPCTPFCIGLALMWSAIIGVQITARHVYLCLAAMKILRQSFKPKRDNLVDLAGYARVGEMVENGE